ncbi:MAG TPA: hypothetical protein VGQ49_17365 [Bryobacteraceae bacterium]|jgi:transcriptional regulator with XRE-family HTH domain|nr:hypothetical protein [Bryobacteraceae bacterium]
MDRSEFARSFRDALGKFLSEHGDTRYQAAKSIGLSRARLNTYFKDDPDTKRPRIPSAEVLYLLCSGLGFTFEYQGFRISAETITGVKVAHPSEKQLSFEFERQFYLTNDQGAISVRIKKPAGRIELSVSLSAESA